LDLGGDAVKDVAVKVFRRPETASRLSIREARLVARLSSAGIVPVIALDPEAGILVTEYVDGFSLDHLFSLCANRGVRLPKSAVLAIGLGVCAGLEAAHEATDKQGRPAPVFHRDIKPSNLMLDRQGAVRLLDFGIAVTDGGSQEVARSGTPGYMPPEQLRGGPASAQTDIHALGMVLFEAAAGRRWTASSGGALPMPPSGEELEKLLLQDLGAFQELAPLLRACLEPDPAARPASVRDVRRRLNTLLDRVPGGAHLLWLVARLGRGTSETSLEGAPTDDPEWNAFITAFNAHGTAVPRTRTLTQPPTAARRRPLAWVLILVGLVLLAVGVVLGPRILNRGTDVDLADDDGNASTAEGSSPSTVDHPAEPVVEAEDVPEETSELMGEEAAAVVGSVPEPVPTPQEPPPSPVARRSPERRPVTASEISPTTPEPTEKPSEADDKTALADLAADSSAAVPTPLLVTLEHEPPEQVYKFTSEVFEVGVEPAGSCTPRLEHRAYDRPNDQPVLKEMSGSGGTWQVETVIPEDRSYEGGYAYRFVCCVDAAGSSCPAAWPKSGWARLDVRAN